MADVRQQLDLPEVAKQGLRLFLQTAEQVGMDVDLQRRSLQLSQSDWQDWLNILHDAPLPSRPPLPVLLRQLGCMTYCIDRTARKQRAGA
jgi:hypothetical protein